jgi:signal peptidase II
VTKSWLRLFGIGALVVALDIWTKRLATAYLSGRPPVDVLGEFVRLTYTRNSGVAFGLGAGVPFPYYLFSIAAVVVILYLFARQRAGGTLRQVALSLVLGGAVGNLIDRLASGEVVDFIEIGYGRWHWPVFNVADSAVTIGVTLFALSWPHDEGHARGPAELPHEPEPESAQAERGRATGSLPGRGPDGPLP